MDSAGKPDRPETAQPGDATPATPPADLTRRAFLRRLALSAGSAALSARLLPQVGHIPSPPAQPPPPPFPAMDLTANPYRPQRQVARAERGMVATSQPLAVQAGLAMLRQGGNAVDAALAAAIALTVVEPTSNGFGSDAFALVWDGTRLWGLNGSGRAPAGLTPDLVRRRGYTTMPQKGWLSVTVPGAPAAWRDLHARFGKLPFATLCEPAIGIAQDGYAVTPIVAAEWSKALPTYTALRGAAFAGWAAAFAPGGRAPRSGERWASPAHAATLRRLAATGAADFYTGETARSIARFAAQTGGLITEHDLAGHTSTWVNPLSTTYRGYTVWEMPPNGQGIAALQALNILEGFALGDNPRDSAESFHRQIEAMKLAFADAFRTVADPAFGPVPTAQLLAKDYAAGLRARIGTRARSGPGNPNAGGTVYLCAADSDGMLVSFIQSNYSSFGSGVVVPGTGVALHNRGANFTLDPAHPNHLAPGKRPYHTIIPGFLSRGGQAIGPFGVMGGFMQPQGHVQMIVNTLDYGMNPQMSLDAPRWQWVRGTTVAVESDADPALIRRLRALGHDAQPQAPGGAFGRGQIIWRLPSGEYVAGSDRRGDGYAGGL